ncbi:hypothetical protein FAM21834_00603 [Lentilactobacillus parabuchneri]|jgi:hypothetical protein|uniref:Uncharacterized protein n=2 Tax=Lentilactobacillus parabuchneri TaxID=152331 RepID=A0A1X1FGI8_9LACO|nr:hypothetical protein [Lentilactobacillus parabuchneri]APR06877.1 hypothetical protein FAM21731_00665 [Lentilactobacillus parabuchneri]KRM45309.1 hypothetical protein FC51_GL000898 [Lentilactobacillus parabuchneri DSM 5707 = NBRC 107865]KRN80543.1 hypothetical protein IV42_GL000292 [Lentilactobacillus parabuchneri]MBW0223372.1 hypothetical protein [Lentilactobacillus parabuchneri]MBW0246414.1 hypothetical protein [Lentilactobacillus parabuchneri]
MDYDLIDLGGFTRKNTKILADTPDYQRTRTVFDHRLILITEVDKKDQKIKVSSNFEWEKVGKKFRPNVSLHNANFVDPLAK